MVLNQLIPPQYNPNHQNLCQQTIHLQNHCSFNVGCDCSDGEQAQSKFGLGEETSTLRFEILAPVIQSMSAHAPQVLVKHLVLPTLMSLYTHQCSVTAASSCGLELYCQVTARILLRGLYHSHIIAHMYGVA